MKSTTKLALCLLIISVTYFLDFRPMIEREFLYPVTYKNIVVQEAEAAKVDPALVAAVIFVESKYKLNAASEPGAKGLMQIMPETAKWIQEQRGEAISTEQELHNPKLNIKLGTWYLSHLLKVYKGNEILALAAYNAGQGYVEEWKTKNSWSDDFSEISKIPFAETKAYVNKVLRCKKKYQELYNEER